MDWLFSFSLSRVVFICLSVFSLFSGSGLPPASPNPITPPEKGCAAGLPRGQSRATFSPTILHNSSAFHVDGAFVKEVIYFGNYSLFSLEICKVLY